MRTLYIRRVDEKDCVIRIKDDWKITYGPLVPGSNAGNNPFSGGQGQKAGFTLRIYETKEKQRLAFNDVVYFRDLAIPLIEPENDVQFKAIVSKAMEEAGTLDDVMFNVEDQKKKA
jgi:hypothetical protein